jgi:tetratricopeptide (TPR) repeat protein
MLDLAQKSGSRALARLETGLKTYPDRSELLALTANVHIAERNFVKAEETLRRLISVDPSNVTGYAMLGQVYLLQRKLDAGKAEFEKRIGLNPKDITAHLMVAMINEAQRRPEEAEKKYEEVLGLDSRSVVAANNLAYLYAENGRNLDRALSLAQMAAAQAPDNPAVQDTLGWVFYKKALPDLALRPLEFSVAKEPGNPTFHYHLGLAQLKNGDITRGRQSLQSALKLRPNYTEAQRALKSVAS